MTITQSEFNGGFLITVDANSPVEMRLSRIEKGGCFSIANTGKSTLTIFPPTDENKSIQFDGVNRRILKAGESGFIFSDDENFYGIYAKSPKTEVVCDGTNWFKTSENKT